MNDSAVIGSFPSVVVAPVYIFLIKKTPHGLLGMYIGGCLADTLVADIVLIMTIAAMDHFDADCLLGVCHLFYRLFFITYGVAPHSLRLFFMPRQQHIQELAVI